MTRTAKPGRTRRRQWLAPFGPTEMGRRFRRALEEAGWGTQVEAVRAIREAVPGTGFSESELSSLIQGYRMPSVERLIGLAILLGLDLRTLFPECFDAREMGGDGAIAITRRSHPWLFRDGCRRLPRQEWNRRRPEASRTPPEVA